MNLTNRRNFLFASSGAVAGIFTVPGLFEASEAAPMDFSQSGLVTGNPKPLNVHQRSQAAGWAMLVKHPVIGKLHHLVSDENAMGVLWMATHVIDTYERAFDQ